MTRAVAQMSTARRSPIDIDVQPKPFQLEMLEALSAERQRGHFRNLVVSPTGTGKTWVSAFDYQRLRQQGLDRLLFVAHRDEILRQSQDVFRRRSQGPGLWRTTCWRRDVPLRGARLCFHSVSVHQRSTPSIPRRGTSSSSTSFTTPRHRRTAELLARLRPNGPPRADRHPGDGPTDKTSSIGLTTGSHVTCVFGRPSTRDFLCPFHYFGVADGTDLRSVGFERWPIRLPAELEGVLTGDHVRARRIIDAVPNGSWIRRRCALSASVLALPTPGSWRGSSTRLAGQPLPSTVRRRGRSESRRSNS